MVDSSCEQKTGQDEERLNEALVGLLETTDNWSDFFSIDPVVPRGTAADFYRFMAEGIPIPPGAENFTITPGDEGLRLRSDLSELSLSELENYYLRYLLLNELNFHWEQNKALPRIFSGLGLDNDRLTALA